MRNDSRSSQRLVKNRISEEEQIDRLSDLHDSLLLVIFSLLPIEAMTHTSVLSRRLHHIWKAIHLIEDCTRHSPNMDDCALLRHGTNYPLTHLTLRPHHEMTDDDLASLLRKAQSLGLRHLKVRLLSRHFKSILPVIFSFDDLLSLSFDNTLYKDSLFLFLPSLTRLKTLSLGLYECDPGMLNEFLARLYSLDDLSIEVRGIDTFTLMSRTVRKLKLTIMDNWSMKMVRLSIPNLECLVIKIVYASMPYFSSEMPHLRTAFLSNNCVHSCDVSNTCDFLKKMMNVENLKLDLAGHWDDKYAFHMILDPSSEPPIFRNLKSLDLSLCFHEQTMDDLIRLLQNSPLLESLNLIHKEPYTVRGRKRKLGNRSRLPPNAKENNQHVYFTGLHIEENRKQLIKLLTK